MEHAVFSVELWMTNDIGATPVSAGLATINRTLVLYNGIDLFFLQLRT